MTGIPSRSLLSLRRPANAGRRGSTLLIVLGVLSLLVLLAVALSYRSRLDLVSARNYQEAIQRRTATTTGVAAAARRLYFDVPRGPVGLLNLGAAQLAEALPADVPRADAGSSRPEVIALPEGFPNALTVTNPLAEVAVSDASARINVNTAPAEMLEAFFRDASLRTGIPCDAPGIARAIVSARYGADGRPGDAIETSAAIGGSATPLLEESREVADARRKFGPAGDMVSSLRQPVSDSVARGVGRGARMERSRELFAATGNPARYSPDIRRPGRGDDERWTSLDELVKGAGVPEALLREVRDQLTVFSAAQEMRIDGRGATQPLLDLNRATAREIYEALADIYAASGKDDLMLRQFACNVVDARDSDRVPTRLPAGPGHEGDVLGVERTPVIVEVYAQPQSISLQSNDGQYVQIYNPWNESFDLTGWRLEGVGGLIALSGQIPARGFLIVTNDKDNANDASNAPMPGEGSLYDIFGVLAGGPARRIIENRSMTIPNRVGSFRVRLLSREGDLVDTFPFEIKNANERGLTAFKRVNPVVRDTIRERAIPFGLATPDDSAPAEARMALASYPADAPFTSVTELFEVFQGYALPDGTRQQRWTFPAVASPSSTVAGARQAAADPRRIDARMIDLFTIEAETRRAPADILHNLVDMDGDGRLNGVSRPTLDNPVETTRGDGDAAGDWEKYLELPRGLRYGLVNLNTASTTVLRALPGLTDGERQQLIARREAALQAVARGESAASLLYRRPSELLTDDGLWSETRTVAARLEAFDRLNSLTTLTSSSFVLVARPLANDGQGTKLSSRSTMEVLLATDRQGPSYVALGRKR